MKLVSKSFHYRGLFPGEVSWQLREIRVSRVMMFVNCAAPTALR